jgi:3-phosphoshikimate 1-carboxyvinyltransferase
MATGRTSILNFPDSQDCAATLDCIQNLGVQVERSSGRVSIVSRGWPALRSPDSILDARNSGTTMRLLAAVLACRPILSTITGDQSLRSRPMGRIMAPLGQMGAEIQARNQQYPPLTIRGAKLQSICYKPPVASAQVKSCVLLAGLTAPGKTAVIEEVPTRDHTERALPYFGAKFHRLDQELSVQGERRLRGTETLVPGDFSAAVYFLVAALLVKGSEVRISQVGVNPTRSGLLSVLRESGARIDTEALVNHNSEPSCDLLARYGTDFLDGLPSEIHRSWIPNMIDEIPLLAILASQSGQGMTIRGAEELRKKESDRIGAVVANFTNIGLKIEEFADGFHIPGKQSIRGGHIENFGDHRVAMAFAVAGLLAAEGVTIDHPEITAVSFPGFFKTLSSLYGS